MWPPNSLTPTVPQPPPTAPIIRLKGARLAWGFLLAEVGDLSHKCFTVCFVLRGVCFYLTLSFGVWFSSAENLEHIFCPFLACGQRLSCLWSRQCVTSACWPRSAESRPCPLSSRPAAGGQASALHSRAGAGRPLIVPLRSGLFVLLLPWTGWCFHTPACLQRIIQFRSFSGQYT